MRRERCDDDELYGDGKGDRDSKAVGNGQEYGDEEDGGEGEHAEVVSALKR